MNREFCGVFEETTARLRSDCPVTQRIPRVRLIYPSVCLHSITRVTASKRCNYVAKCSALNVSFVATLMNRLLILTKGSLEQVKT